MHSFALAINKFYGVMVSLVAFFCAVTNVTTFAAEPNKLLIAHGAISNNVAPLWIAKEQGIFRKYNVDPQLIYIIAGRAMQ